MTPELANTARSSRSLIICATFTILVLACEKNAEPLAAQDAAINADAAIPDATDAGLSCAPGDPCPDTRCCEAGEVCAEGSCRVDRRGPYCRPCSTPSSANPTPCDDPRNFCLRKDTEQFCGVDCSLGQECPNGYACLPVAILSARSCSTTADCRCERDQINPSTIPCEVDTPCTPIPGATTCSITGEPECATAACLLESGATTGACACRNDLDCANGGTCVEGICCDFVARENASCQGAPFGFCTCAWDSDCPTDACDPASGACIISGVPCTPGQNDCPVLPCVNGVCVIGQNCLPSPPATCED